MGDTSSLLGNNCPMLYILYMLYKQSKICKSQCLVDSVLQGETGTRQGPFLGHHGSGWGLPAASPSCWALTGSGAGSGPAAPSVLSPHEGGRGGFGSGSSCTFPPSLPRGAQHGTHPELGVTQLLPSPQPPPGRTSVSLGGPGETIPRGKAETGSEHPASPAPSHAQPAALPGVSYSSHELRPSNPTHAPRKPVSYFPWYRSTTFEIIGHSRGSLKVVLSSYIFIFVVFSYQ